MKLILPILASLLLASCASRNPASHDPQASASLALGNVKATAVKSYENKKACVDVNMDLTSVTKDEAAWSNWEVSWTDAQGNHHPVTISQREPASSNGGVVMATQYYYEAYNNHFKTCFDKVSVDQIKGITLKPKQLPFAKNQSLELNWL